MGTGRRDGLAVRGLPPLILREPQHERPNTGDGGLGGITLTLALSHRGRGDLTPQPKNCHNKGEGEIAEEKGMERCKLRVSVGVFFSASNGADYYQLLGIVNQIDYSPRPDAHSV